MRVATFNVHYWTDRAQRPTGDEAIELLRQLHCDAVVLQEVPEGSAMLARVAAALRMHHAFAPALSLGNALLSRTAPRSFAVHAISAGLTEARSVFIASLPWEGGSFTLAGTHLDPNAEHIRMQQLARALARVGPPRAGVSHSWPATSIRCVCPTTTRRRSNASGSTGRAVSASPRSAA